MQIVGKSLKTNLLYLNLLQFKAIMIDIEIIEAEKERLQELEQQKQQKLKE